ncbi:hypothetical protein K2Z83_15655 [Oscillochloris sp. ZM17-4]|uniref:hypothetical protein n=1 Tax=Oscillochloris sp. ZM17-4 TaxID=2866714 RepID=UPI001C734E49|nr:hypothetical protein [Oscillochloris sp. ZM17-4]MBX0329113.1 hypothetical protein [Oscillochloris sp. ZM17-4]
MSHFRELYRRPVQEWRRDQLDHLTAEDLAALCQLFGVAFSGTKPQRAERLWQARHLRLVLAGYASDRAGVEALAGSYRAHELLALCRAAGVYAGPTKYARAAALLKWRDECRRKGQEALRTARSAVAGQPRQARLF